MLADSALQGDVYLAAVRPHHVMGLSLEKIVAR
jgi:hypothetical protein